VKVATTREGVERAAAIWSREYMMVVAMAAARPKKHPTATAVRWKGPTAVARSKDTTTTTNRTSEAQGPDEDKLGHNEKADQE
jgi:hypothetical protein